MKYIYAFVNVLCLFCSLAYGNQKQNPQQPSDMLRKTYKNFSMGYTLRYFDKDWTLDRERSAFNVLLTSKFHPTITVNIWSDDEEKNLTKDDLEEKFKHSVSGFAKYQIEDKKEIQINNLNFQYYKAVITPNDYSKQMFTYMYSGKEGCLIFVIKTPIEIAKQHEEIILSLLQGFSFDGKACRGNTLLRGAKSFLELFTD